MSPVRKVSHHGGNMIGHFPSLKMRRMIAFESLIEYDLICLLDFEVEVRSFEEQPRTIEFRCAGKLAHYTPDFHVVWVGDGQAPVNRLVECKPHALINTEENQTKFKAATEWCGELGWVFYLVTDRALRAGFYLQNVKTLTYHARQVVLPDVRGRILAAVAAAPHPLTVGGLAQVIAPNRPALAYASILHMAFHHELMVPLRDGPLSVQSPVSLPR